METDNPDVHVFSVREREDADKATVYLGPESALITVTKWPREPETLKITGIGNAQTVTMTRQALIGLAYEILAAVNRGV